MIKKLLFLSLLLMPFISMAQGNNTSPILLQMRNGKVYFDNVYALSSTFKKADLYNKAQNWFQGDEKTIITVNEKKGEIIGTYTTRVNIGTTGNYYFVRIVIEVIVYDATYEVKVYDVYEKPVEKGISNEYSKIEYRWWDFRRGHPWSVDDEPLFRGVSTAVNSVMDSLGNEMNK